MQQYYYVPRDMLQAVNTLVLVDELGVTDLSQVCCVMHAYNIRHRRWQVTIALSNVQVP